MLRKLSLAVAISGLLSPVGVHALGLGDIHLGSALNQRLNAEITIHLARSEELEDVKVVLASLEAFSRAGIDRPFLLSGLRFKPVRNSDGVTVITVSSREPIREPFLNFLVEVNWPKGRLLREYTVLLDPPVTVKRKAAQIESPVVMQQPVAQKTAPTMASWRQYDAGEEREYGPVVANDTLWEIASRMRVEGESIEQVMMTLLYINPDAFIHNNINRLKRGAILRLPATDEVKSLSHQKARADFLAQTRQWRDQHVRSELPVESAPKSETDLAAEQDRLRLASAGKKTAEAGAVEGSAEERPDFNELEQELILVRESNEVFRQEGAELRTRVGELEAQLQDIQQLLTLRSDQLTQMQNAQQQQVAAQPETVESAPAEIEAVQPAKPDSQMPVPAIDEEVVDEAVEEVADQQPTVQEEPVVTAVEPAPAVEDVPSVAEPSVPVGDPTAKQSTLTGFIDAVRNNPTLMAIVGGVVALLVALLTFFVRRRKSTEAEFAESILVTSKGDAAVESGSAAGLSVESSDETSLLSDFSPSDIDALQDETGEVDPLSEADVYIAYGRYQQAEELIQQAINDDNSRVDLKFKLLEIYYSTQNAAAYSELAQRLADQGADEADPKTWAQIVSMGHELVPHEALFGATADAEDDLVVGGAAELEQAEGVADEPLDELADLDDFDLGDYEAELGLDDEDGSLLDISEELSEEAGLVVDDETLSLQLSDDADETLELGDLDVNLDSVDIASELGGEELDLESLGDELEMLSGDLEPELEIHHDEMSSSSTLDDEPAEEGGLLSESDELLDEDEIGTKLDLARAYADMGDKEGAENILREVISEGSDEQQQEAEELLGNL